MPLDAIIDNMCKLLESGNTGRLGGGAQSTIRLVLLAIMKMVAQYGSCPTAAAKVIDDYTKSSDPDAQKRCLEFQSLLTQAPHLLTEVFPVDASLEDVEVDADMSFLDGVVSEAISNGARTYNKPDDDDDDDITGVASQAASAFKMTPYEKPQERTYGQGAMSGIGSGNMGPAGLAHVTLPPGAGGPTSPQAASPQQQTNPGEPQLALRNVANVWGKKTAPVQTPAAPSVPPTSSFANTTPSTPSGYGSYGGFGASNAQAAPMVAPVKTAEQLEKERMAAALFGGISSAPAPPPFQQVVTPQSSVPQPTAVQIPAAPPVAARAPAPEVDLLGFDIGETTTTAVQMPETSVDMLAPTPLVEEQSAPPAPSEPTPPPAPTPAADPCKFFIIL